MIGLAFIGWLLSRYLAAFQFGYIDRIWEPFFGDGTVRVLTSEMSKMWPISDAGLGATAYTFELLMAWMGGKTRWRTMPWMVTFFFILVVPLGLTHIVLVISQPVVVGEWCTICLAAAAVMLVMIPFTIDEVVAMGQFMAERVRAGKPFWWTFFVGDTTEGGGPDRRTAWYGSPLLKQMPASAWGITVPITLILSVLLGIWLMFAPAVLGNTGMAANSDRLVGAVILTVAAISTAEVVRAFRFLNLLMAVWLVIALGPCWRDIGDGLERRDEWRRALRAHAAARRGSREVRTLGSVDHLAAARTSKTMMGKPTTRVALRFRRM